MIHLGKTNTLEIERESPHGIYLTDDIGNEVLLPNKYVTEEMEIGEDISVFIYKDSEGRNVATTEVPKLEVGEIALLEVYDVNDIGAFMEWGVEKHLLIPFSEQGRRLRSGDETLVYLYLDDETHRLVGTTKLMRYLDGEPTTLKVGQGVELMMWHETNLGYTAIIDGSMVGLVYQDDIYEELWPGDIKHGYVKRIREDGKIDLSLRPFGYNKVTEESQKILDYLNKVGGTMPYTDKSDPSEIARRFKMSKKVFKKALGLLYKQKLVVLSKDETKLAEQQTETKDRKTTRLEVKTKKPNELADNSRKGKNKKDKIRLSEDDKNLKSKSKDKKKQDREVVQVRSDKDTVNTSNELWETDKVITEPLPIQENKDTANKTDKSDRPIWPED